MQPQMAGNLFVLTWIAVAVIYDCGCIQTGQCSCRNCNFPVSTKAVPTPVAKAPDCGCAQAGSCLCPEGKCGCATCAARRAGKAATVESDQAGNPWVLGQDGYYYRYTKAQLDAARPSPVYYAPAPAFTPRQFFGGGGGCSSGGWR